MQKALPASWFFITCLLIIYAAHFIIFMSNFYFVFKSTLNQCCHCNFVNLVGKNHVYFQDLYLNKVPVQDTRFYPVTTSKESKAAATSKMS